MQHQKGFQGRFEVSRRRDKTFQEVWKIMKPKDKLSTRFHENECDCKGCQRYYSISTVAAKTGFSVSRIKQFVKEGVLKVKFVNGSKRIPHIEVLKIISDEPTRGYRWLNDR